MERKVVITGLGIIAPKANTISQFWENLENNINCIEVINKCDTRPLKIKVGGQVYLESPETVINRRFLNKCDDFSIYTLLATQQALMDAKLDLSTLDSNRIGIYLGNNSGGWHSAENGLKELHTNGVEFVSPYLASNWFPAAPQGHLSIQFHVKGYSKTVVADMASSNIAIGNAYKLIKQGKMDYMIAGGVENLMVTWGLIFYQTSGLLNMSNQNNHYAPFCQNRNGLILSEGAGIVILESKESALKRNAPIYGEICGYGLTNDGVSSLKSDPNGIQYARAIRQAMADWPVLPDYVSLNGCAVENEDDSEMNGLNIAFKENTRKLLCSCPKTFYGHSYGAAGAMDVICACLMMKHQTVIKTQNTQSPVKNVKCNLLIEKSEKKLIKSTLVMNKGLGGINSALLLCNLGKID